MAIIKRPIPQRLQPRTAWKAAFDVSTAALFQISVPTLMMKSAWTNLLRATVHPTRPPTIDETDQPGSSENSDDTDSGGADAIATAEDGQNTLSQETSGCQANNQNGSLLTLLIFLFLSLPKQARRPL